MLNYVVFGRLGQRAGARTRALLADVQRMLATQRLDGITADGNQQALATLIDLLDTSDKESPIVTP